MKYIQVHEGSYSKRRKVESWYSPGKTLFCKIACLECASSHVLKQNPENLSKSTGYFPDPGVLIVECDAKSESGKK